MHNVLKFTTQASSGRAVNCKLRPIVPFFFIIILMMIIIIIIIVHSKFGVQGEKSSAFEARTGKGQAVEKKERKKNTKIKTNSSFDQLATAQYVYTYIYVYICVNFCIWPSGQGQVRHLLTQREREKESNSTTSATHKNRCGQGPLSLSVWPCL